MANAWRETKKIGEKYFLFKPLFVSFGREIKKVISDKIENV